MKDEFDDFDECYDLDGCPPFPEHFYFEELPIAVKVKWYLVDRAALDETLKCLSDPEDRKHVFKKPYVNLECAFWVLPNEKINFTNLDRWWSELCSQVPKGYDLLLGSGKFTMHVPEGNPIPNLLPHLRKKKRRAKLD